MSVLTRSRRSDQAYTPAAYADTVPDFENLQRRLQTMVVFVAELSGRIVGTVGISTSHTSEAHLRGMAVVPSAQGKGIAQQLLSAALDHCRSAGCTRVTLDTTAPLRAAIRFYEKNGFSRDRPGRGLLWNGAVRFTGYHSTTAKDESESSDLTSQGSGAENGAAYLAASFQACRCRGAPGACETLGPLVFVLTVSVSPPMRRWRNVLGDAPMNRLNARLKEASDS